MAGTHGPDRARKDPQANQARKARSGEDFDIIIGLLAFWGVTLFLVTAALEVTGHPSEALGPALILLLIVLALWGMWRLRKTLPERTGRQRR